MAGSSPQAIGKAGTSGLPGERPREQLGTGLSEKTSGRALPKLPQRSQHPTRDRSHSRRGRERSGLALSSLEHLGGCRQAGKPGSASSLELAPVGCFLPRLRQCVVKTWQMLSSLPVCTFPFPAGLWLYLAGSSLPCLTLIGSPNFGYRSVHRDLEAQIAIVTESRALQQQLHQVC